MHACCMLDKQGYNRAHACARTPTHTHGRTYARHSVTLHFHCLLCFVLILILRTDNGYPYKGKYILLMEMPYVSLVGENKY
jgi:hypothetical protein